MEYLDTVECEQCDKINTTIAIFRNFTIEHRITNAAVIFWESHTDEAADRKRIQATSDLIYKTFDIATCEALEVRTGYLSRYNFLKTDADKATEEEWLEAVTEGLKSEEEWVKRCDPYLPGFRIQEWDESISPEYNRYHGQCKSLLCSKIKKNENFRKAFFAGIDSYAERHDANRINGFQYMLEEMAWICSLPLVYWDKPVYLIHVGNDNPGVRNMFELYPSLQKSVKRLSPRCIDDAEFENLADFLMYYKCNNYAGCSYATEHIDLMQSLCIKDSIHAQRKVA